MNSLQKKEFYLLKCFDEVCKKLNIEYFMVCGSALGAVKYGGFIPWDDDIDVALYRDDYEYFLEHAQVLLPDNVFLQNYKTDSHFPQVFSKLRDSSTTYIEKSCASIPMNHGIYIDIFPLDGYPTDKRKQKKLEKLKNRYKRKISCVYDVERDFFRTCLQKLRKYRGYHKKTRELLEKYNDLISAYDLNESKLICNHGNWQGELEYAPVKQYGKGKETYFEGLKVRVPEMYDEYLSQKYGNWRNELPKEQQKGHHYYEVCDVNRPYAYYIRNNNDVR